MYCEGKMDKTTQRLIAIKQSTSSNQRPQAVDLQSSLPNKPTHQLWPVYENETSGSKAGVWESTAGSWEVTISGYTEFCVIKEGEVEIVESNGTQHTLVAGDSLVMEDGFVGVWTVPTYARKYYFISQTVVNV